MGNSKSKANVVGCITDNDCYKNPGFPKPEEVKNDVVTKPAENTTTCCAQSKVTKYDKNAAGYIADLSKKQNDFGATYEFPAVGFTVRECINAYPTILGEAFYKNGLTLDSIFANTGL